MNPPEPGRPLQVALRAAEPGRRELLALIVKTAGHALTDQDEAATVALIDDAPGVDLWAETAAARVVLSDAPAVARDPTIRAVLPRGASPEQIDAALRAATAGLFVRVDEPASPGFRAAEERPSDEPLALLTPREIEILGAVGNGMSNKQAARLLGISAHTVKFHLEAIFAKLGANTRAEAVAKGLRRGLIDA